MNIIVIGYRGVGKTSIGKLVAKKLNMNFADTDMESELYANKKISDIISQSGWKEFRKYERIVARKCLKMENAVISAGGGTFTENKISVDKKNNRVVLLTADVGIIEKRISGTKRPSLTGKGSVAEIREILKKREQKYFAMADLVIDTSTSSKAKVAGMIIDYMRKVKL